MKIKPTYQDLVKEVKKLREEIKLKESENKFKSYFESNKAIMLQLDTETKQIICANKTAIDFYGYSKEELFKKSINDLNTLSPAEIISLMKKAVKKQSNYFEFKHKLANGEIRDVAIYASPTMIGKEIQMFVTVYDVTKQKKTELEILRKNNELAANDEEIRTANEELIATTDALKENNNELIIAKEEAEANEKKYKHLSNITVEGIFIHDKGIAVDVNQSFANMMGYKIEEIIGKNVINLFVPEKYHKLVAKKIAENDILPYEIEGIRKDGSIFPVEIEARNIENENYNTFVRVVAVRDISWRKKTETQLKKLSTAVDQSANTIVITNIEGNIEYTNPKFTEITGYTASEAFGKNPRILNAGTQSKDYYVNMWETLSSGKIWKGEFHNKKKNGNLYWEQVTITPIENEEGKIINYLAIKEDITERKKARQAIEKERLFNETLIESTPGIFFLYEFSDNKPKLIKWNKNHETLLGYTKEDLQRMFASDFFPPEQFNNVIKAIEKVLSGYESEIEVNVKHKKGYTIPYFLKILAFESHNKQYFLGIGLDISNQKKNEKELIIAKEKAEESDQLKTEFLHNLSHEVRTPLNGILGFSNLLDKSGFLPEKQQQHIQFIQKSGEQLLHIIDDILEISRLVTRQVKVKNESINLNDLLKELYADFEIKAKEKQLTIYLKKEFSAENCIIITDKLILNKILYNLLENALKYTNKGFVEFGYKLLVKTHSPAPNTFGGRAAQQEKNKHAFQKEETAREFVQLYVKDTGVGIRPEKQKLIFERFSQEEKDISHKTGGLGLGLSIAMENTKLLNGAITLESEKGKGATFFVTIPYNSVSSETENLQIS